MMRHQPGPVSIALTMHDVERLRRLAMVARTNMSRMALRLLSDMLDRQVRVQAEKCSTGERKPPARAESA